MGNKFDLFDVRDKSGRRYFVLAIQRRRTPLYGVTMGNEETAWDRLDRLGFGTPAGFSSFRECYRLSCLDTKREIWGVLGRHACAERGLVRYRNARNACPPQ